MSTIEHLTELYDDSEYSVPVGLTGYVEMNMGKTYFQGTPEWMNCPVEIAGKDEYNRPFCITETMLWVSSEEDFNEWGFTPLVIWRRYNYKDHPVMLWRPGYRHDKELDPEEIGSFRLLVDGNKSVGFLGGLKVYRNASPSPDIIGRGVCRDTGKLEHYLGQKSFTEYLRTRVEGDELVQGV